MPDNHFENPRLAQVYDLDSGWSVDRDFYLSLAKLPNSDVLDLGCGTGLLCDAYAEHGHSVVGVEPSAAMLEVARSKPFGKEIEWVQSIAQEFDSAKRFDLIIMTGHAFQVLLEDSDVLATLSVMRKHLKTDGIAVFESRNPRIDWENRWAYEMKIDLPASSITESRRFLAMKNERMTFELKYVFPDETLTSQSELRFMRCSKIKELIDAAGLRVSDLFGDWDGTPFDEGNSEEMIFVNARAD